MADFQPKVMGSFPAETNSRTEANLKGKKEKFS